MASTATLKARLTLNNAAFMRGMSQSMNFARGVGREILKIGATAVGIIAIGKAAMFMGDQFRKSIDAAAQMQNLNVAFKVMTGSAKAAGAQMKDVLDFARDTSFEIPEVAQGAKQLMAYGFQGKELVKALGLLGNVAAGLNVPLGDLVYVYGTLRTQGRAYARDIMQFTQRGVPLVEELSRNMGVTKARVMEMVSEGKIGFAQVEQAFTTMTSEGGKFGGMLEAQSRTWSGQMAKLKDNIFLAMAEFGKPIIDQLTPVLNRMNNEAGKMSEIGKKFGEGMMTAGKAFIGFFQNPELLSDAFWTAFEAGALQVGNVLIAGFKTAVAFFKDGMMSTIQGIGNILIGTLMKAFASPIATWQAQIEKMMYNFTDEATMTRNNIAVNESALRQLLKERQEIEGRKPGSGSKGLFGINNEFSQNDYERVLRQQDAAIQARKDKIQELVKSLYGMDKTASDSGVADIAKRNMADGGPRISIGGKEYTADELTAKGRSQLNEGFAGARRAIGGFEVKDELGAGQAGARLKTQIQTAAAQGQKAMMLPKYANDPMAIAQLEGHYGKAVANQIATGQIPDTSAAAIEALRGSKPTFNRYEPQGMKMRGSRPVTPSANGGIGKGRLLYGAKGTPGEEGYQPSVREKVAANRAARQAKTDARYGRTKSDSEKQLSELASLNQKLGKIVQ